MSPIYSVDHFWGKFLYGDIQYPLVNVFKAMGNHHFAWVNQRPKWSFSIANCHKLPEGRYSIRSGLS